MTERLANFLSSLSVKVGAALFAIYLVSQISIGLLLGHKLGAELVPMQLSFTKARFESIVGGWDETNLQQFQHHFYLDFIHPVWYGLVLAWTLAKLVPQERRTLVLVPVVAALCDLCENTIHAVAAFRGTFNTLDQPLIGISSSFALTKWSLALVSLILIGYYFFRRKSI